VAATTVGVLLGLLQSAPGAAGVNEKLAREAPRLVPGTVYVVKTGDTLWSIAIRMDPSGDPRPLVQQMERQAGGTDIVPGEHLRLP
jgi:LysM repeat protein